MSDVLASLIRTTVNLIVGGLATAALRLGVTIDTTLVLTQVQILVTAAFYAAVRYLETNVNPHFGWLLGVARAPKYPNAIEVRGGLR